MHHLSHRSTALLLVATDGVRVQRPGLDEVLLPWDSIESVEVETALAGKVVSTGMLLFTWHLGARTLRTAFRADDRSLHASLLEAASFRLTAQPTAHDSQETAR